MKCKVVVREWLNDVEFYFYEEHEEHGHEVYVAKPIELIFEKHPIGDAVDPKKATFTLRYGKAIDLVESLLSEARFAMLGSAQRMRKDDLLESGELKAMREHLADMKKLVFDPPKHFTPTVFGNATSGISMLAGIPAFGKTTPGRVVMPGSGHYDYDTVAVKANRVRRAAKQCQNAKSTLAELFPEVFGPGWEHETD